MTRSARIAPVLALIVMTMGIGPASCSKPPGRAAYWYYTWAFHPPPELRGLRIHVRNATVARAGKENVSNYTIDVRGAVQRALIRAGYVVVVDPSQPFDVVAEVNTNFYQGPFSRTLTCSMTLRGPKAVIDQASGEVEIDEAGQVDERGVIVMVTKEIHIERLRRYVELLREQSKTADPNLTIAEPPAGRIETEPKP
jgi:hypothetical protein